MSNIMNIASYAPQEGEKFFLDTNVWLYLFCPIGEYKEFIVEKYNNFFLKILRNKGEIYTSAMVISEFFNVYARIEFSIKKDAEPNKYVDYKRDFRNTEEYKELAEKICALINDKILKYSIKIDDSFSTVNTKNILSQGSNYDFNDNYFVELCKINNLKIVTNDKDFLNFGQDIDILTSWKI